MDTLEEKIEFVEDIWEAVQVIKREHYDSYDEWKEALEGLDEKINNALAKYPLRDSMSFPATPREDVEPEVNFCGLGPGTAAFKVWRMIRLASAEKNQNPTIETFIHTPGIDEKHRGLDEGEGKWRVCWESGPNDWAILWPGGRPKGSPVPLEWYAGGFTAEPNRSFDLLFSEV